MMPPPGPAPLRQSSVRKVFVCFLLFSGHADYEKPKPHGFYVWNAHYFYLISGSLLG